MTFAGMTDLEMLNVGRDVFKFFVGQTLANGQTVIAIDASFAAHGRLLVGRPYKIRLTLRQRLRAAWRGFCGWGWVR